MTSQMLFIWHQILFTVQIKTDFISLKNKLFLALRNDYVSLPPPTLLWGDIHLYCFCPVRLSVTQFVSATPLILLNRISWNLVDSKDTICSCAYYQEILISWILWELCFFEIRNFPKFTTEAVVSATPLKLLNRISWNLVGTKDTIFSRAYYQEIWSPKLCGSYLQTL